MEKILFDTPMSYPNKKGKWSHLVASDLETLHAFAKKLGLPKYKFQNKKKKNKRQPHYDIQEHLVEKAIKLGAVQVQRKEVFLFLEANYS
jgi:translation initiation factor IF-3